MKKADAEQAIRYLVHRWAESRGFTIALDNHASWSDFKSWLAENRYTHYLNLRSVSGADYDAEMWFGDECKQNWRR